MDKFMNKDGGSYNWVEEHKVAATQFEKLVLGFKETIPGSEMSYKDLNEVLPEVLKKLPDVLEEKAAAEEPKVNGEAAVSE